MNVERCPWILGKLVLRGDVVRGAVADAVAAYARDEEACGLLVGPRDPADLVDAIVPMENRANKLHALDPAAYPRTGRTYFDIDPLKFAKALADGERAGRPAKVLYHSHLDVGAYFSETDALVATMGGAEPAYDLTYIVLSARGGKVDDVKRFVWDARGAAFVEAPFVVEE